MIYLKLKDGLQLQKIIEKEKKVDIYDEVVDSSVGGTLKVFTHSTLESGNRKKNSQNIINIFVLANPLLGPA